MIGLRFEARRRRDAECIGNALEVPVSRSWRGWLVAYEMESSSDLERVLATLQACLEEQAIPMVTVVLGDERYVMEPKQAAVTPSRRA